MSSRVVRRSALLLALLPTPAIAQFAQLAATDDGSQLYFTSQLLLRNVSVNSNSPFPEARLYRFGPDGVTLFAERGSQASANISGSGAGVQSPQVSGDGSVIGFTLMDYCATDPHCQSPGTEGEIRGQQTLDAGPGALVLSHNGRWALLTENNFNFPVSLNYASTLLNLTTGERTNVPPPPVTGLHTIAADGSLLVAAPGAGLNIWRQGQLTPLPGLAGLGVSFRGLTYTDDASTIVFIGFPQRSPGTPLTNLPVMSLMALDIASGNRATLFQSDDATHIPWLMGVSSNAKVILYRVSQSASLNGSAYFFNRDTGQSVSIDLPADELVSDGALTGPGDIAFLVTTGGRIVKATQSTHTIETLFPASPYCDTTYPQAAGSLAWLTCSFTGALSDLQNRVFINQIPVPVLGVSPGQIEVQIPWEIRGFFAMLNLQIPGDSPFITSEPITVLPESPRVLTADPALHTFLGLDIIKGDWSGYQTDPPAPGDIVHLYMTGLGPVRGAVQTGVSASTTPNPILAKLTCRFKPQQQDAETLFAGLAPGMIGLYQVSLRIPSDASSGPITGISGCSLQGDGFSGGFSSLVRIP